MTTPRRSVGFKLGSRTGALMSRLAGATQGGTLTPSAPWNAGGRRLFRCCRGPTAKLTEGAFMPEEMSGFSSRPQTREGALSRWDNEGGAARQGAQKALDQARLLDEPPLTNAELVQLRVRLIALENLVIALLAESSDQRLETIREMAAYISPRPGFTPHPLTIHAASHMIDMVERAEHFRS
jgi:hypothetical protein